MRRCTARAGRRQLAQRLAAGEATLLSLWGEPGRVHMALLDTGVSDRRAEPRLPRQPLPVGRRAASRRRSGWNARCAICSGSTRSGCPTRGPGSITAPNPTAYPFLPVEGEGLHQIPVGPVHAGIIEPGHFRFTCDGETVVRLEQRLGYVHKGIDALMHGATLRAGGAARRPHLGRQHGRLCASPSPARWRRRSASTPPPRAVWLRARDGGAGAHRQPSRRFRRDLQRRLVQHHAGALRHAARARAALRRRLLRPSADDGLHRARRRRGRSDAAGRRRASARWSTRCARASRRWCELYDETASLQDRTVGTGILQPELARRFGAGGYVGRASGRDFDARRHAGLSAVRRADASTCRC